MILYKYNRYPLQVAVNYKPGDLVNNLKGDIFFVNRMGNLVLEASSVLRDGVTVFELSEFVYKRLFITLSNKKMYVKGFEEFSSEDEED